MSSLPILVTLPHLLRSLGLNLLLSIPQTLLLTLRKASADKSQLYPVVIQIEPQYRPLLSSKCNLLFTSGTSTLGKAFTSPMIPWDYFTLENLTFCFHTPFLDLLHHTILLFKILQCFSLFWNKTKSFLSSLLLTQLFLHILSFSQHLLKQLLCDLNSWDSE